MTVLVVIALPRSSGWSKRLPQLRAIRPAVSHEREPAPVVVSGGEEDAIAPDDRRGIPFTGERRLPQHVLRCRPRIRIAGAGHESLSGRPPPSRPVLRALTLVRDHANGG